MHEKALTLIKKFEGRSLVPYLCPGGLWTIGWGHRMSKNAPLLPITAEAAEHLLKQDIERCATLLNHLVRVPLTSFQEDALISFVFNVGGAAFQRSTLRMKVNRGEHEDVPRALQKWVWSGGKKLPGLVLRRKEEAFWYAK